jgi:hypothetical protein
MHRNFNLILNILINFIIITFYVNTAVEILTHRFVRINKDRFSCIINCLINYLDSLYLNQSDMLRSCIISCNMKNEILRAKL